MGNSLYYKPTYQTLGQHAYELLKTHGINSIEFKALIQVYGMEKINQLIEAEADKKKQKIP